MCFSLVKLSFLSWIQAQQGRYEELQEREDEEAKEVDNILPSGADIGGGAMDDDGDDGFGFAAPEPHDDDDFINDMPGMDDRGIDHLFVEFRIFFKSCV